MSVRISIRKNWLPPLLKIKQMKKPVRALDWWAATSLVIVQKAAVSMAGQPVIFGTNTPITDTVAWNQTSLTKLDLQLDKVAPIVYNSNTDVQDTDAVWVATRGTPTNVLVTKIDNVNVLADQPAPADNAWWTATTGTVVSTTPIVRPTSATRIQDQATPADNNWWDENSATTVSSTPMARSTSATRIQDQANPADNAWWMATGATVVAGPVFARPTSATRIQDQANPTDNAWWTATTATAVAGPSVTRPTQAVYIQNNPTAADIGWWAYPGE